MISLTHRGAQMHSSLMILKNLPGNCSMKKQNGIPVHQLTLRAAVQPVALQVATLLRVS